MKCVYVFLNLKMINLTTPLQFNFFVRKIIGEVRMLLGLVQYLLLYFYDPLEHFFFCVLKSYLFCFQCVNALFSAPSYSREQRLRYIGAYVCPSAHSNLAPSGRICIKH